MNRISYALILLLSSITVSAQPILNGEFKTGMEQVGYYLWHEKFMVNDTIVGRYGWNQIFGKWQEEKCYDEPHEFQCEGVVRDFNYAYLIGYGLEKGYIYGYNGQFTEWQPKVIGAGAFSGDKNITSVGDAPFIHTIEACAFQESGVTTIDVFPMLVTIGDYAFSRTPLIGFDSMPILQKIGARAFEGCNCLLTAALSPTLLEMGEGVFKDCTKLEYLPLVQCVLLKEIPEMAFYQCEDLNDMEFPSSLNRIGSAAFWGCHAMKRIVIPEGVNYIGPAAFGDCTKLKSVKCKALSVPSMKDGSAFYDYTYENVPLYVPAAALEAYKSAEGWKNFKNIQTIESMPSSVDDIETTTQQTAPAYDLSGRRCDDRQNGIVITGGKKVFRHR